MNGTIIEVTSNTYGTHSRVEIKDPADGLNQYFNIPGRYKVGDKVLVEFRLNNDATHTSPLAADTVEVTHGYHG